MRLATEYVAGGFLFLKNIILNMLTTSTRPKSKSFLQFYLLGLLSLYYHTICYGGNSSTALFGFHLLRRTFECIYIHSNNKSEISLPAYFAGIFHYLLAPITLVGVDTSNSIMNRALVLVWVGLNWVQFKAHRELRRHGDACVDRMYEPVKREGEDE